MQDNQQNVDVSGEDENASSQSENNKARGGGSTNSLPTPLSNSDKPPSLSKPTAQKVEGCNSEVVSHQNAGDGAPNPLCEIKIPPPTPPKIGQSKTTPPHGQKGYNSRGMDIIIRNNNVLLHVNSPSNSAISDSPLSGKDQEFYDLEERPGGCTGDHTQE